MSTEYFPVTQRWILPELCLSASLQEISQDGKNGNEGIVLWLGHRNGGEADVTHLVRLRGSRLRKEPDFLQIEAGLMNEVATQALQNNVVLIGQVHSHGSFYGVDLSTSDRQNGIAVPYYLSIVLPDYGLRDTIDVSECGVHVFEPNMGFRRLQHREIQQRIQILPGRSISWLTAGKD